jgi:acetyl esterase/lipase
LLGSFILLTATFAGEVTKDIEYAHPDGNPLALDLYKPDHQSGPLIVYIHGGAWRSGSKKEMPLQDLVDSGCAVATIDYRLSTVAKFPAQIHDIKAAIRYLRGNSQKLSIDAKQTVVAGSSAGGHLAALVGVTNGHRELEGDLGDFRDQSSAVQGIISFFGASDLTTILNQSTPHGLSVREPALDLLLGAAPDKVPELARLASPIFHVDKNDPPLLLFHGDQDPQMPINQSLELQGAYEKAGIASKVQFKVLHGAAHGGKAFYAPEQMAIVQSFLETISAQRDVVDSNAKVENGGADRIKVGMTFSQVAEKVRLSEKQEVGIHEHGGVWYRVPLDKNRVLQLRFAHPRNGESVRDTRLNLPPQIKPASSH